jgi:hypothetical protein
MERGPSGDKMKRFEVLVLQGGRMTFETPCVVDFGSIARHTFEGDKGGKNDWWHGLS